MWKCEKCGKSDIFIGEVVDCSISDNYEDFLQKIAEKNIERRLFLLCWNCEVVAVGNLNFKEEINEEKKKEEKEKKESNKERKEREEIKKEDNKEEKCLVKCKTAEAEKEKKEIKKERKEKNEIETFFNAFWEVYPRKVAKVVALRAFTKAKINADLLKQILANLRFMCNSAQWKKGNGQFVPYPASYINQRRWEDETVDTEIINAEKYEQRVIEDRDRDALINLLESMKTCEEKTNFIENIATDYDRRLIFSDKASQKWRE